MSRFQLGIILTVFCAGVSNSSLGGGSGLNVLVVVNPNSPASLALGNYYCERRLVPPQNVLRLENWTGGNVTWTRGQFQNALLDPLVSQISTHALSQQIDFVLLSMDIPYEVSEIDSLNTTTSVLFYGFKPNTAPVNDPASCSLPFFSSNSYAFSEASFRDQPPDTAPAYSFLAMMLTASNLASAELTVDQGLASDGAFPSAPVYLAQTSDSTRNSRAVAFDDAVMDATVQGNVRVIRTNLDSPYGLSGLLGYQTGLTTFGILSNAFVPGAMADNLTSFGGVIFQPNDQTTLLAFLAAGATGSYGTVAEPCSIPEKFPSPRNYFYQARGFSLAESYYQSLLNPYQGLLVGEPLAAPFARRSVGSWGGLPQGSKLVGMTNLTLQFEGPDVGHPIQQVDLFVDGTFMQTLTNVGPTAGDLLSVAVNGVVVNYSVPSNATLNAMAAELAGELNAASNLTHVHAVGNSDRIALRWNDPTQAASRVLVAVSSSSPAALPCTSFVAASRTNFLESNVLPIGVFEIAYTDLLPGDWLMLNIVKTNGTRFSMAATNSDFGGTTLALAQSLEAQLNNNAGLQGNDGVAAHVQPLSDTSTAFAFNVQARSPGLGPSRIQAAFTGSCTNSWVFPGTGRLETNVTNTQPRNHLYVTAGVTNLLLRFQLDTTTLPDGYHELTAVAYEGTHVRTQTHLTRSVIISNTPLTAVLTLASGDTNAGVESTLNFLVSANTDAVASIELFSTGGSLGQARDQGSASFSIRGTYLGAGLHPFYALVTAANGSQYRTQTQWVRLLSEEPSFKLAITGSPPLLTWPAITGRRYDVLSTDSLSASFQLRHTIFPTNGLGQWLDDAMTGGTRFYRINSWP